MKQKLLKTMLLLCALIVGGVSSVWADDVYVKVTSTDDLVVGGEYLIVNTAGTKAAGATSTTSTKYATTVTVSVSESKITNPSSDVAVYTLGGTSAGWTFYSSKDSKYLYWGSGNSLNVNATVSDNTKWTISLSSGTATIANVKTTERIIRFNSDRFACYTTSTGTLVSLYKKQVPKTDSNLTITNSESTINLSIGGTTTGDITYTTSSDGTMHFTSNNTSVATVNASGTVTAVAEGSTTITVSQDEGTSYAASSNLSVTINVSDARTAVGSITAISPTTVYVGQIDEFTLTESYSGVVASKVWSLGTGEDTYLDLDDNTFEGKAVGDVNVTVTATPTDASTYKPVSATFPVSVEYKYSAPSLPTTGIFTTTKNITIGTVSGADVYYTTDGTTPTNSSTKYTDAFDVTATTTVKAIAIDGDGLVSPVASATYTKEAVFDINGSTIEFQGSTITFDDGKSGYNGGADRTGTITNSDASKSLKISGSNIMMNSSAVQFKAGSGTMTTEWIQNGAKALSVTPTFSGGTLAYTITYANGSASSSGTFTTDVAVIPNSFPCKVTMSSSSGTILLTKLTLTSLKDPIATGVSITDPGTLAKGATGTFVGASTDADDCSKAWTSSDASVIEIKDAATGTYEAKSRGTATITYTITPGDETTYRAVSANINVNVTEPVVITASDVDMTYGDAAKAIGATTSAGYAGTLSYSSGNTNIATVDASGKVTAVAVGTTTITISAPADAANLYTAGDDKVINVTVNAPAGGEVAATNTQTAAFEETLLSAATGWTYTNWTTNSTYGACSTAGMAGTLKTKDYTIPEKANPCVSFEHTGKTFADPSVACKLYVQEGDNTPVELTIPTYFVGDKYDNPYIKSGNIDITAYRGKTVHFIFEYTPSTENEGKWEVKNFGIYYDTFSVKLNGSGYATYCSEYPLDFSDYATADYSAWQITGVNTTNGEITFTQITGDIKGGQGILLKGEAGKTVTLTSADSENTLTGNRFVGTLAPTYVAAESYFGLKANAFVPVNAGTVPAGKALLPFIAKGIKSFTFVFEDATGIKTVEKVSAAEAEAIFNLAGQRIQQPQKGINIINGRKVVVK